MVRLLTACISFCATSVASAGSGARLRLRSTLEGAANSFIRSLHFEHVLRVCNVYPYDAALDVYLGEKKLSEEALGYKACGQFAPSLKPGDEVGFKVGDSTVGSFTISDLPQHDAVLLMVVYRHDTLSTAVSFESHVFAKSAQAQVAVIDTYRGEASSELRIQDQEERRKGDLRSELLRYESVVAVTPGIYDLVLQDAKDKKVASDELVAAEKEAYVVLRCGIEAQQGKDYPQELVVYPRSDPGQFQKDGATGLGRGLAAVLPFLALGQFA